jgi:prepilin peptidase CpaA
MPETWTFLAIPPLVAAASADIGWRIIPNWVPIALVAGFAVVMLTHRDLMGLSVALVLSTAVLLVGLLPFGMGLLGAGDVKLAAALSLWLGPDGLPEFFAVTAIAGGLLALVMLVQHGIAHGAEDSGARAGAPSVPYGVAIAIGGFWALVGQP